MNNNEIFRNLLHLTGCGGDKENLIYIFELGGIEATNSKIKCWRTDIDNPRSSHMPDDVLNGFILGLFEYRDEQKAKGIKVFNFPGNE